MQEILNKSRKGGISAGLGEGAGSACRERPVFAGTNKTGGGGGGGGGYGGGGGGGKLLAAGLDQWSGTRAHRVTGTGIDSRRRTGVNIGEGGGVVGGRNMWKYCKIFKS